MSQIEVQALIHHLPDLGESLNTAATDLGSDCTIDKVDSFLWRLQAAESLLHIIRKEVAHDIQSAGSG